MDRGPRRRQHRRRRPHRDGLHHVGPQAQGLRPGDATVVRLAAAAAAQAGQLLQRDGEPRVGLAGPVALVRRELLAPRRDGEDRRGRRGRRQEGRQGGTAE